MTSNRILESIPTTPPQAMKWYLMVTTTIKKGFPSHRLLDISCMQKATSNWSKQLWWTQMESKKWLHHWYIHYTKKRSNVQNMEIKKYHNAINLSTPWQIKLVKIFMFSETTRGIWVASRKLTLTKKKLWSYLKLKLLVTFNKEDLYETQYFIHLSCIGSNWKSLMNNTVNMEGL